MPYYKVDWDVTADGGSYGGYGEALRYSMQESRSADNTVNNIQVQLPKGNIKIDRDIKSQVVQVQAPQQVYAAPAYKPAPAYPSKPVY